ncbi:serine/threonine-protein kinase [Nocardioides dongxiaopingii]|uniref:serine/threonine-protein kinase n=1 Tax=Nocardioides dongxiaopingii TaxID=2576036 RepID=UPI0010C76887|nr:serine/threonine-protein kinase [Nocardioides dongxiaopingii]
MTTSSETPEKGALLGPFRLGRRLGVGGMGIVFQALDTQLNRQVALKVITPRIGDDEGFRARFTREAQAQASLDSPHVVQVYSFGEADGRLYIASQLIPDGDLGQMLARHGRPPARIAVNLISQVADGLADAHAAGLIHRDIKPANVLLRNRDNALTAYLGDFGIARQVGAATQLTQVGGTVGTPTYMAPELHTGSVAGPASDIYSLGCLLWATLSGRAPYSGATDYQIVMAHLEDDVPQLAPTGPLAAEVNRVLQRALAKQPGDRYPSATAMRDDLRRVVRLPDDPTPVRPLDDTERASEVTTPRPGQPWRFAPPQLPTPTPTPAPGSRTPAPAAPPFRTPSPAPPTFNDSPGGPPSRPGPSKPTRRRRTWVAVAVLAVVLGVGGVVTTVLLVNGADGAGGGGGGGTADPTADPTTGQTTGQTTEGGSSEEEERAIANLTAAFLEDPTAGSDPASSACIARNLVEQEGVDGLQQLGILDDDLQFLADADDPAIAGPILQAGLSCIGDLLSSSPPAP